MGCFFRHILVVVVLPISLLSSLLVFVAPASAQELSSYRVAVWTRSLIYTDPRPDPDLLRTPRLSYRDLTVELLDYLEGDPRFAVLAETEVSNLRRTETDVINTDNAQLRRDDGIEQFREYELQTAIDTLERAIENYRESAEHLRNPREVAPAYEYLGRAYLEAARQAQNSSEGSVAARRSFRELIRLNPGATILPGFYPPDVVEVYEETYLALLADAGAQLGLSEREAAEIDERLDVDYILFPFFLRDETQLVMVLQVFDVTNAGAPLEVWRESVILTTETETSIEPVSRLISRFVACIPLRYDVVVAEPIDAGRWFFQLGWGAGVYGDRPTQAQFLNQGFALTIDHHLTENFGLVGRANFWFGDRDPAGDLLSGFTSLRFSLGVALSVRASRFRFTLGSGLELNQISSITATSDFWCKVSGGDTVTFGPGRDCRPSEVVSTEAESLIGAYLMPTISVDITGPFAAYLQGNFAFYVTDALSQVGFPLAGEAGVEYRF